MKAAILWYLSLYIRVSKTSSLFWLVWIKGTEAFEIKTTANCASKQEFAQILSMLIEKLYRWYLLK